MTTLPEAENAAPQEIGWTSSPKGWTRQHWRRAALCLVPLLLAVFYWIQPESYPWLGLAILGIALLACLALALTERSDAWVDPVLALGTGLLTLAAYVRTLSPTTDIADSLEFQVVAHHLTFAHPPGYPLYTLGGKLFTLLPIGDIAYRMNLYSACTAAAAVTVLYLIAARLSRRPPAALAAALVFAFAPAFWSQAVITEVYALNTLIVGVVLYGLVRWTEAVPPEQPRALGWLLLSVFAFALGTLHHLTIIFVAPVLAGVVLLNAPRSLAEPRKLVLLAAAFVLGLLPVLYFFARWPAVHGRSIGPVEVFRYVTARGYASLFDPAWPIRDPSRWLMYRNELASQFNIVVLLLAVAGLVWLARRRTQWAVWLGLIYLLYTGFRLGYNAWDGWVVLMPAHLVVAVGLAAGLAGLAELVLRDAEMPRLNARAAVFWTFAMLLPLVQLWHSGPAADMSGGWPDFAATRRVLDLDLPEGAVIVVAPRLGSALLYGQLIEGVRPDLRVHYADTSSGQRVLEDPASAGGPVYLLGVKPEPGSAAHFRLLDDLVDAGAAAPGLAEHADTPVDVAWSDRVRLVGYTAPAAVRPGDSFELTLFWRRNGSEPADALMLRVDAGAAGSTAQPLPAPDAWGEGDTHVTRHSFKVPLDAGAGALDFGLRIEEAGRALSRRSSKALWAQVSDYRLAPIAVRTDIEGVDAPQAFADGIRLVGFGADRVVRPGERIDVRLGWEAYAPPRGRYRASVQLLDADGVSRAGNDREILFGTRPTSIWQQGERFDDVMPIVVPQDAPPGGYQLQVLLYDQSSHERLPVMDASGLPADDRLLFGLAVLPESPPPVAEAVEAAFGNELAFQGYRLDPGAAIRPGEALTATLRFAALHPPSEDYTLFAHLLDGDTLVAQWDGQPFGGAFPTRLWPPGEALDLPITIEVPPDPPQSGYRLAVGWYNLATGERLPLTSSGAPSAGDRFSIDLSTEP